MLHFTAFPSQYDMMPYALYEARRQEQIRTARQRQKQAAFQRWILRKRQEEREERMQQAALSSLLSHLMQRVPDQPHRCTLPPTPEPIDIHFVTTPELENIHVQVQSENPSPEPSHPSPVPSLDDLHSSASKIQSAYKIHKERQPLLAKIANIHSQIESSKSSLDFESIRAIRIDQVKLTAETKPLLSYENNLIRLLLELDDISGDKIVRKARKECVKIILAELKDVDEIKNAWIGESSSSPSDESTTGIEDEWEDVPKEEGGEVGSSNDEDDGFVEVFRRRKGGKKYWRKHTSRHRKTSK